MISIHRSMIGSAAALVLLALPLPAAAQEDVAARAPSEVRTAGSAERSVRPDLAVVTFSFQATGRTPLAAGRAVAARADSLRRALQTLGIPRDSLISGSRWHWWRGRVEKVAVSRCVPLPEPDPITRARCEHRQDTTYKVSDEIEVRLRDLSRVGAAIDTALAYRVTEISGVRFQATDVTAAHEAALREATERARRQAETIAAASGGRLGRTLSLSTERDRVYDPYYAMMTASSATAAGYSGAPAGTEVIQPSISVRVTVYGRWELLPRQ